MVDRPDLGWPADKLVLDASERITSANKQFTRRRADARLARQAVKEVACEGPGTRGAVLRPALAGS